MISNIRLCHINHIIKVDIFVTQYKIMKKLLSANKYFERIWTKFNYQALDARIHNICTFNAWSLNLVPIRSQYWFAERRFYMILYWVTNISTFIIWCIWNRWILDIKYYIMSTRIYLYLSFLIRKMRCRKLTHMFSWRT